MTFAERLARAQQISGSLVCVGLDPDPAKLPKDLGRGTTCSAPSTAASSMRPPTSPRPTNRRSPSTARSARKTSCSRAFATSASARRHALVILDAKRNDIGNTAEAYAREAFDRYGADAVTVNPYMGEDSVRPFLARPDRGALIAVPHLQSRRQGFSGSASRRPALVSPSRRARRRHWNEHGNLMLVVGATYPREMAELRQAHPDVPFLVPGYRRAGRRSGSHAWRRAWTRTVHGLLISSSRNIIYAGGGSAEAIRAAAAELHAAINRRRTPLN
jgi:orotidine-5'-phosphate decarboxylase